MVKGIGHIIRKARQGVGMTCQALGAALGVSGTLITLWEQGHKNVPPHRWGRLVEVLPAIDLDELAQFAISGTYLELDPSQLSPEQRADLARVLAMPRRAAA
jgi:transcriptional regulator with XRE-family HTH domain